MKGQQVNFMKRIVQLLVVMMMCLALCSCQIRKEQKDDIYIFFTSDVHCGVDENLTLASLKALVDDTKAEHPYVTLVDCGDYLQGGALGTLSKGSLAVELMNEMNYDIVTIGNHEFDYGMDALEFGAKQTEYIYKLDGNPVGEFGGFFQVSGLKYTVDTSIESSVMLDDNNMFAGFENDKRRVKDVLVLRDGEYVPIDPKAYYSVAASNYALFRSGDGNTIFSECERIIEEGPVDVLGLIDFCQSEVFIPENYMKPDGRITIE